MPFYCILSIAITWYEIDDSDRTEMKITWTKNSIGLENVAQIQNTAYI